VTSAARIFPPIPTSASADRKVVISATRRPALEISTLKESVNPLALSLVVRDAMPPVAHP
jgi:hypothetical protein